MSKSQKENYSKEEILQELNNLGEKLQEAVEARKQEMDAWWEELPYEDKLRAFYSVVKRIYKGDVIDQRSYRGVLYGTFNFDTDSYGVGMECNYIDLHNVIFAGVEAEKKEYKKKNKKSIKKSIKKPKGKRNETK
jgi:hypothetical protein